MRKLTYCLTVFIVMAFLAFIAYGLDTDCPDTAIYVYCGGSK